MVADRSQTGGSPAASDFDGWPAFHVGLSMSAKRTSGVLIIDQLPHQPGCVIGRSVSPPGVGIIGRPVARAVVRVSLGGTICCRLPSLQPDILAWLHGAPRRVIEISIEHEDLVQIDAIARSRTEPACRVERARILLAYRSDPSAYAVGAAIGVTHQTVQRCLDRAARLGTMVVLDASMLGVHTEPRSAFSKGAAAGSAGRSPITPSASNATGMVLKSGTFREPEAPSEQASAAVC